MVGPGPKEEVDARRSLVGVDGRGDRRARGRGDRGAGRDAGRSVLVGAGVARQSLGAANAALVGRRAPGSSAGTSSSAGLPGSSANVWVGPPWSASGPSSGSATTPVHVASGNVTFRPWDPNGIDVCSHWSGVFLATIELATSPANTPPAPGSPPAPNWAPPSAPAGVPAPPPPGTAPPASAPTFGAVLLTTVSCERTTFRAVPAPRPPPPPPPPCPAPPLPPACPAAPFPPGAPLPAPPPAPRPVTFAVTVLDVANRNLMPSCLPPPTRLRRRQTRRTHRSRHHPDRPGRCRSWRSDHCRRRRRNRPRHARRRRSRWPKSGCR